MEAVESLLEYYKFTNKEIPSGLLDQPRSTIHFNILESESCLHTFPFMRRDYYKICLVDNSLVYQYGDRKVEINGPSIIFSNPSIPYSLERKYECNKRKGYICLFNEEYLSGEVKSALLKLSALYSSSIFPYIELNNEEYESFLLYFKSLKEEYSGDFEYRKEIIVNLLRLIIYLSIKTKLAQCPSKSLIEGKDRIVKGFINLLNRQFPLDSPNSRIIYRTPAEFANQLNVHVNHLNHALKEGMGKSTSQLIQERILTESIALIRNSDWSITEIGYGLGFEYPQHFSQFIKKQTGQAPSFFKNRLLENI